MEEKLKKSSGRLLKMDDEDYERDGDCEEGSYNAQIAIVVIAVGIATIAFTFWKFFPWR